MPDTTTTTDAIRTNAEKSQPNAARDGASAALTYAQAAGELAEALQAIGIRARP